MKRVAGTLAVGIVAATYFATFLRYGTFGEDEGLLLMQFARTFRGELPYVDFHTGYPPASFYLNALLFHVFGESVVPVRALLVVVNATSTALLFALARPLAGTAIAATMALGWAAYLPLYRGHFASFNIPYPSWYAICAALVAQSALDRHLVGGRALPLVAAGAAAGTAFAFKQNSGALALLASGLVLAILHAGDRDPDRPAARALIVLAAAFLLAGFAATVMALDSAIIVGPALILLALRLVVARGTVPRSLRLVPAIACLGMGALLPSLPWLAAFLPVLGWTGLGHEILLLGTDFHIVYASPYPFPLGMPAMWPVLATLGLAGAAWLAGPSSRRRLGAGGAVAIAAAAAAAAVTAIAYAGRMPHGMVRSVVLQVEHVGFYAAPLLVVVAGTRLLGRLRIDRALGVDESRLLGAIVFAACSLALIYPRVDTMHLILALPSSLVLAAWATRRIVERWAALLGVSPRPPTGLVAATGIAIGLVAVAPNLGGLVAFENGTLRRRPQVTLESARVPVHVEVERGEDLRALNALFDHLRREVAPDEPVFAFPSLALVPFALGLRTATPHDYFFAGRPDHLEEAVIVRQLRETSPRWVVTLNRRLYFFYNAPAYYFMLRDFLRSRYTLAARFGRYDVLRRRDVPGDLVLRDDFGPEASGERTLDLLADVDAEWRRAGARAVIGGGTPDEIAERVARLAPGAAERLLVVRALGGLADPRAIPFLLETFRTSDVRLRTEAAVALTFVALGTADHAYIIAGSTDDYAAHVAPVLAALDPAVLAEVLRDERRRPLLGVFALWAATERGDVASVPLLEAIAREEASRPYLQASAYYGLARLGEPRHLCALPAMLGVHKHELQDTIPSLLLGLPPSYANDLTDCLVRGLAQPAPLGREVTAWVAGSAGLGGVGAALDEALDDPDWRVRIAASWATGKLRHEPARARLAARATDADPTVRAFALEALARLEGAPW